MAREPATPPAADLQAGPAQPLGSAMSTRWWPGLSGAYNAGHVDALIALLAAKS